MLELIIVIHVFSLVLAACLYARIDGVFYLRGFYKYVPFGVKHHTTIKYLHW